MSVPLSVRSLSTTRPALLMESVVRAPAITAPSSRVMVMNG